MGGRCIGKDRTALAALMNRPGRGADWIGPMLRIADISVRLCGFHIAERCATVAAFDFFAHRRSPYSNLH